MKTAAMPANWLPPGPPVEARYDKDRDTSTLFFADKSWGEFQIRGGICWPIASSSAPGSSVMGFVVILGLDTSSGKAYILEEKAYVCIDHVVAPDGSIEFTGLGSWLNGMWSRYFCNKYFYNSDRDTFKRYNLQIIRSPMIRPAPVFLNIHWEDVEQAKQVFLQWGALGKFYGIEGTELHRAIRDGEVRRGLPPSAAVHALFCAISGIDRYPFRPPSSFKPYVSKPHFTT